MAYEFTIHGQVKGGKNNYIVTRQGKHIPRKAWAEWRDHVVGGLNEWMNTNAVCKPLLSTPLRMTVIYVAGDKRRRDMPAMLDSIFHCLERAGIVKDDCLIEDLSWANCGYSKDKARAVITLEEKP